MQPTPELLAALTATTGAIGVISLALYFFTFQKVRALSASEGSVKRIIQGEGLFQADQVILILKEFSTDEARLEALKQLARVQKLSEEKADRVYSVIRKNVDVNALQNDRYRHIQAITARTGPFFAGLALIAGAYDLLRLGADQFIASAPPSITIEAAIAGTHMRAETRNFSFHHQDSDGNCDANRASDKTWCLPKGWRVADMGIKRISANCNSSIASPSAAGESCAFVGARVAGCGYDNLVLARNCKGRGFIEYELTLSGTREDTAPIPEKTFTAKSAPDQRQTHFVFHYGDAASSFAQPRWTYQASVKIQAGSKVPRTIVVTDTDPNKDGVVSRLEDGALRVDINPEALTK